MKKIEVIVTENEQGKFEVVDQAGKIYSTCSRKYDAKRAADKNDDLIVVEEFTKFEIPAGAIEKANEKKIPTNKKKIAAYERYKTFIMQNFDGVITATGEFPKSFCETFGLTLSKKKRSLTFERVLEQMESEGILTKVVQTTGKYQKLQWQFTNQEEEL